MRGRWWGPAVPMQMAACLTCCRLLPKWLLACTGMRRQVQTPVAEEVAAESSLARIIRGLNPSHRGQHSCALKLSLCMMSFGCAPSCRTIC